MTGAVVLGCVSVVAVTGCVTVRAKEEPHRSPGPGSSRAAEAADGAGEPPAGRPSPHEGLSRPAPAPGVSGRHDARPGAVPEREAAESGALAQVPPGADGPAGRPAAGGGAERRAPALRPGDMPGLPGGARMCDLGRRYGGWDAGSAPQDACERAYGR
ncbi:hypothetical protein RM572_21655 [Streptomyces sp. DSM 42041]|uniref:Lipoprotein n=1 Tax=Streptomyces hazeniae TaxID=3075538 RepID=A0ABU2NYT9_9ACTN|nr:hypothetical protein [Streptomyces sp. DSM 42041]MDT0381368.1 hypothetical protein [Streptomyces sp. DSM 42041]